MADDDDWDDVLGDRAKQTVSPDVVRKLLEMNPALRERGMTTNVALDQMNDAQAKKPTTQKPASTSGNSAKNDLISAMKELRTRLDNGNARIDAEMAKLKKAREDLATAMRAELTQWFVTNDPSISSPVSQRVLNHEKAFLQAIAFSIDRYVDERSRKK